MTPIRSDADLVALHEGCELEAYRDTEGVWTVGRGCTGPGIGPGTVWTQAEADEEFAHRMVIARCDAALAIGAGYWKGLDPVRRAVLTDMAYELGGAGLAKFHDLLAAMRSSSWDAAARAALDSKWARQVPNREAMDAAMLRSGEWPG